MRPSRVVHTVLPVTVRAHLIKWSRVCNSFSAPHALGTRCVRTNHAKADVLSGTVRPVHCLPPLSYVQSSTKHTHVEQSFPARMFILAPTLPVTYLILLVLCHDVFLPLIFIFHFCLRALREKRREATRIGTSLTVKRDPVQTPPFFVYKDMPEQYFFFIRVFSCKSVPGNNIIPRFVLTSLFPPSLARHKLHSHLFDTART